MSAPGSIELDEDVGVLLDEGGVVGVVEIDHLGMANCEEGQQKDSDQQRFHIF
jgi:hypothetical protein